MMIRQRFLWFVLVVAPLANAFVPQRAMVSMGSNGNSSLMQEQPGQRTVQICFLSSDGEDDSVEKPMSPTEIIMEQRRNPNFVPPTTNQQLSTNEEEQPQYPLNVPSPILLASSIFLAIVSTGSLFQFADDQSNLVPAGIALFGIPSCIFLFYAAITKATAETEEDDKKFLAGK